MAQAEAQALKDAPLLKGTTKCKTKEKAKAAQGKKPGETKRSHKSEPKEDKSLTVFGEDMACYYLGDKNISVLERNWKCESGEANIIAVEDDTLVFIEVKTRSSDYPGLPEYAITKTKRDRFERIAIAYLSEKERPSGRVRFDVIVIRMTGENQCMLRHHRDAFA